MTLRPSRSPNGPPSPDAPASRRTPLAASSATVCVTFDGHGLAAREGETVAAALLANGRRVLRRTGRRGEPRGLYCGMGVCFDCLVQIDGRPNVRACQTPVAEGMRVETQQGAGSWEGLP